MTVSSAVVVENEAAVLSKLTGVEERLLNPGRGYLGVMPELEAEERSLFSSLGGKYVLTGATQAALTQTEASGAIREFHGPVLVFGTDLWYAHFLRKDGKSAVLELTVAEEVAAAKTMVHYVLTGQIL